MSFFEDYSVTELELSRLFELFCEFINNGNVKMKNNSRFEEEYFFNDIEDFKFLLLIMKSLSQK